MPMPVLQYLVQGGAGVEAGPFQGHADAVDDDDDKHKVVEPPVVHHVIHLVAELVVLIPDPEGLAAACGAGVGGAGRGQGRGGVG